MKCLKCEICLIQVTCTKVCVDFAFQITQLDHEIKKNKKRIISRGGHRRKGLKDQSLVHYNALIKKWNRAIVIRDKIWDRQMERFGVTSSTTSSGGSSGPSVSSDSTRNQLKRMPLSQYYSHFCATMKRDIAMRLRADHKMITKGKRKCFRRNLSTQ